MIKRIFDLVLSLSLLIFISPIIIFFLLLVWMQDFKNPVYAPYRAGKNLQPFKMYKIRSMVLGADKIGVDSTGNNDIRITFVGKIIRKFKIDELSQLFNVVIGNMSLVGPRPNVIHEAKKYTKYESLVLSVRPGITDFASIVFSDEGKILESSNDPNADYDKLIRPGKGWLGVFYIENRNLLIDIIIILITVISIFSRSISLKLVTKTLKYLNAPEELITLSKRDFKLVPGIPFGSDQEN